MAGAADAGIPVVAGYDTREAPLYPPEGLFVDATAIYDRVAGRPKFSLRYRASEVMLNGRTYKLAADPTGAGDHLKLRVKRLAKSGFAEMIRPSSMPRKPQIYLLDPYDPNKTPLLMVHGLQSTPVAFAALVNALRSDPEIRAKYQTCDATIRKSYSTRLASRKAKIDHGLPEKIILQRLNLTTHKPIVRNEKS